MIVELFGPPCAGKTTFARMLAAGLQTRGLDARTMISARPSEAETPERESMEATASDAGAHARRRAACEAVNGTLLRMLPPQGPLWNIRLRRYLRLLAATWARSDDAPAPIIFDQGYTQALCSLVSLTRRPAPACVTAAAALLPVPALRINLTVPRAVLDERLARRAANQSLRERLLELDGATILEQDRICGTLFDLLDERGSIMRAVSSSASDMVAIVDAVAARLSANRRARTALPFAPEHRLLREVGRP